MPRERYKTPFLMPNLQVSRPDREAAQRLRLSQLREGLPLGTDRNRYGMGHSTAERVERKISSRERTAAVKATQRDFDAFMASLAPDDAKWAREHGLHKLMPEGGFQRPADDPDALSFADRD